MTGLTINTEHQQLRQLRPWLETRAVEFGFDADLIGRVELAVHELAANIIDHSGAGELNIRVEQEPPHIVVQLRDRGRPALLPTEQELAPHPRTRGYGLMIAEQLTTDLQYQRDGSVNEWRATFTPE